MIGDGVHEILFEGGDQPIWHLPPVRVSAATYVIEDLLESLEADEREIAADDATLAGGNATLEEPAGHGTPNPRRLVVSSTSGFAAEDYVQIVSAEGAEQHRVVHVDTNNGVLVLAHELAARHPADDTTVRGCLIAAEFPEEAAETEAILTEDHPLRIVWTYTIGEQTVRAREQIRLVRNRFRDQDHAAVEQTMRDLYPAVVQHIASHSNSLRDMVRAAMRQLRVRLDARGFDVSQFMAGSLGHELAVAKTLEVAALNGIYPNGFTSDTYLDAARAEVAHLWNDFTGRPKNVVDVERSSDVATASHTMQLRNPTLRP